MLLHFCIKNTEKRKRNHMHVFLCMTGVAKVIGDKAASESWAGWRADEAHDCHTTDPSLTPESSYDEV